jgi:hypothetical protein
VEAGLRSLPHRASSRIGEELVRLRGETTTWIIRTGTKEGEKRLKLTIRNPGSSKCRRRGVEVPVEAAVARKEVVEATRIADSYSTAIQTVTDLM